MADTGKAFHAALFIAAVWILTRSALAAAKIIINVCTRRTLVFGELTHALPKHG
jgi:hypothetical protein